MKSPEENSINRIAAFERNPVYEDTMQDLASAALPVWHTPGELGSTLPAMDISPADYVKVFQRRHPDIEARILSSEDIDKKHEQIELRKKP